MQKRREIATRQSVPKLPPELTLPRFRVPLKSALQDQLNSIRGDKLP
jgi:hypothetical protein